MNERMSRAGCYCVSFSLSLFSFILCVFVLCMPRNDWLYCIWRYCFLFFFIIFLFSFPLVSFRSLSVATYIPPFLPRQDTIGFFFPFFLLLLLLFLGHSFSHTHAQRQTKRQRRACSISCCFNGIVLPPNPPPPSSLIPHPSAQQFLCCYCEPWKEKKGFCFMQSFSSSGIISRYLSTCPRYLLHSW